MGGQGPPRVKAVKVGTAGGTPSQCLLSYFRLPSLGGLSNSGLQRGGEMGEGEADATPPSLRETAANRKPSGLPKERSLTFE